MVFIQVFYFADRLLKHSKKIGHHQNHLDVHAVPLIKSDESCSTFKRFFFGNPDEQAERRTLLVLGSNRTQAPAPGTIHKWHCQLHFQRWAELQLSFSTDQHAGRRNCWRNEPQQSL